MKSRLIAFYLAAAALAALLSAPPADAAVRLSKVFGDSMVLQQGMAVPVWGWANPGEKVTVSFAGQQKMAAADAAGKWIVRLDAMPADKTSRMMTVAGGNTLTIKDVLVGEVWVCSGQSNMWWSVAASMNFAAEQAAATHPTIRMCKVLEKDSARPQDDIGCDWIVCSPEKVGTFTAVGYFFARELIKEIDAPVGLINSTRGATRIEPWTPPEGFRAVPELKDISQTVDSWFPATEIGYQKHIELLAKLKEWLPKAEAAVAARQMLPPMPDNLVPGPDVQEPTRVYNSMIAPIIPYAIRGVLWYQGEWNGGESVIYCHKMRALIGGWRQLWGEGDFPFCFVQLPNYGSVDRVHPAGGGWALTREAQSMALAIPNTGMAVTIDIGEGQLHPMDKQDVGKRLALWALAKTCNKPRVFSGPLYKSSVIEGNKVRITFDYVEGGLMIGRKNGLEPVKELPDGKIEEFAIAGQDKVWQWADAVIDGKAVIVSSGKVAKPVAVRYAFSMNPDGAKLYNKEGLPAAPFRTDNW